MSPRAYNLGLRLAAAEQTRARIIAAAREILSDDSFDGLSIDAISRRAGVARMTVYYQFTSRRGLLEALYDDIAERGLVPNLRLVQAETDPREALFRLVDVITRFWAGERVIIRRLRGLAVIDQEIEAGLRERDGLRKAHIGCLLRQIEETCDWNAALSVEEATPVVAAFTSFENFDQLAPVACDQQATVELLQRSLRQLLSL